MRIDYDPTVDVLTVVFLQDAEVDESEESRPGVILDYDRRGELVSIEILDASRKNTDLSNIEFSITPQSDRREAG